jgi:hypothetical protein
MDTLRVFCFVRSVQGVLYKVLYFIGYHHHDQRESSAELIKNLSHLLSYGKGDQGSEKRLAPPKQSAELKIV